MEEKDLRVGFVGASGLMGHGLATNIAKGGYRLFYTVHNRVPEGLDELGATRVESFTELGHICDVVMICVTSATDVEGVVDGLLTDPHPGLIILDSSTSEPSMTLALAKRAQGKGVRFADTPLARGPVEAEAGQANVFVGADDELFAHIEPILRCFAENVYHVGGLGAAHTIKLINNTVFQSALTSLAEGFAVAAKSGVDPAKLIEVLSGGGFANGGTLKIMEATLHGDFDGLKFQLDNARKDVRYYNRLADEHSVPTVIGSAIHNALKLASSLGYGAEYCGALTKAQEKINNIAITDQN